MAYPPAKGEPILVHCEGSGAEANETREVLGGKTIGSCRMCGVEAVLTGVLVPGHYRDDVLARIKRGDFG